MVTQHIPRIGWRLLRLPPRFFYAIGLSPIQGHLVLLLATTGRKSGHRHVTPLQYEEVNGLFYVLSARGPEADWFQNILVNPRVEVQVASRHFVGIAKAVTAPLDIARILQLRLQRHPRLLSAVLRSDGLSAHPTLPQLERYATKLAMAIIRPVMTIKRPIPARQREYVGRLECRLNKHNQEERKMMNDLSGERSKIKERVVVKAADDGFESESSPIQASADVTGETKKLGKAYLVATTILLLVIGAGVVAWAKSRRNHRTSPQSQSGCCS